MTLRNDADTIIQQAIKDTQPDKAVREALKELPACNGRLFLVAIGKAAFTMAESAEAILQKKISDGILITKYGHVKHPLKQVQCYEAGHPVSDENTYLATEKVLEMTEDLKEEDLVLFLISGGGSALFEKPLVSSREWEDINDQLLKSGADIREINTIRKKLSSVKGGKFARHCSPAQIYSIILSDVLNDPLDVIASGPAYPDQSEQDDAGKVADKYHLKLSLTAQKLLKEDSVKELDNVKSCIAGNVHQLCESVRRSAEKLGYRANIVKEDLTCEARDAGKWLAEFLKEETAEEKEAWIAGGETVVHVRGKGLGGRNQELALSAAQYIEGRKDVCIFSFGSDGTDGPTDAAGGYVDGYSAEVLRKAGILIAEVLENNDTYHALKQCNGLIISGPTGTNVNDVCVLLKGKEAE